MDRNQRIVRTSIIGIAANLVLVAFKTAVGLATHSIAVILDAVNNLSDALSSIITIIGTKLSGKRPDKKHPYGHGRIEYLTSVVIAVIVLLAGLTSLRESVGKTIHPEETSYTAVSLVIIAAAVVVKLLMGHYTKRVGEEINAGTLIASGSDATFDAVLSFSTLLAAAAKLLWNWQIEGVLGVVISLFIIKAGVEMLLDPINSIIGRRADAELSVPLRELICSFPEVSGAYDLTLHNYGPNQTIGSVHIEVPDSMTARQIHFLTRCIAASVYEKYGVVLSIGVYAANDSSAELTEIKHAAEAVVEQKPEILQMHGFFGDEEKKIVFFDLIVDFSADANEVKEEVVSQLMKKFPKYRFDIVLDSDYSD
ncbi:MAG: cation diffusion facilitator family transporter [Oscillospiraceae bacterium]|nr:cation diffusion facilitator family transporter [Oscillospiraceae bacterium]